jgi:nucleotide-binding universal stress UspA family protein
MGRRGRRLGERAPELWADLLAVVEGALEDAALAFAEARRAPLVAVGAAPPDGLRAALGPSTARRLAAIARQPVLVAPARRAALAQAVVPAAGPPSG